MTFDYLAARKDAEELLAEFGQTATLRKAGTPSGPEYDPTPGAPDDHEVIVVDLYLSSLDRLGTMVKQTTRTLYVSTQGLGVAPEKSDQFIIGGKISEIEEVRPLSPAGTVVLWEVDLIR